MSLLWKYFDYTDYPSHPIYAVRTMNYLAATIQLIGAVFQGVAGEEVFVGSSHELRGFHINIILLDSYTISILHRRH